MEMDALTNIIIEIIKIIKYRWEEIAGTLMMAFIVFYLAGLNNRLNRRTIASTTFRDTIFKELKGLYPIPSEWPDRDILDRHLRQVFPNLEIAINSFRPFVPWYRRWTFDRAWIFYHLGECGRDKRYIGRQYYGQYQCGEITTAGEITERTDGKANFKHNVDKLLSYAKQK